MPRSAVAAECVDAVLAPEALAAELARISRLSSVGPAPAPAGEVPVAGHGGTTLDALVRRLGRITGIAFGDYKQTTIQRRIQRRIGLLRLANLADYMAYLEEHPEEADTLCKDILIHVTSFFRDQDVFEALATSVFPAILDRHASEEPIRIWVPGCATGEEVYSLAIGLLEFLGRRGSTLPIKLFGTDVSEAVVALARAGRYGERIASQVSPERLRQYFVKDGDGYVISKAVRALCVFARQDATRDPPFSNLDLISCRNLLIYLGPVLQRRVLPMFHYALREGGYLVLGTSETAGRAEDLFAVVDARRSIYVRRSVPRRLIYDVAGAGWRSGPAVQALLGSASGGTGLDAQREADRVVLARYAPPGVVIDEELEILQFRGDTGAFLMPAPGTPSNNLLRMARTGLLPDLRAVLEEVRERDGPARRAGVRIQAGGRDVRADIEVIPVRIPDTGMRCFVVLFEQTEAVAPDDGARPRTPAAPADDHRIAELERELAATRDYLRGGMERLEAANEELRAANEEILSSNEELQSTNEELQTAKEELQATNEELLTVNEELQHRNHEATLLGDDLTNLLESVKIPMVMVGRDLFVRRFSPSAAQVLGLLPGNVGRSLLDLPLAITVPGLDELLLEVLDTFVAVEQEVRDRRGHWYRVTVRPYRTQDNRVDGAVVALADIDALKRMADGLAQARDHAQSILMAVREPLLVLGADLVVRMGNRAFYDTFDTEPGVVVGRRLGAGASTAWAGPAVLEALARVQQGGPPFEGLAVEGEVADRGRRSLRMNARAVPGATEPGTLVLLAIEDVTERERERAERARFARKIEATQRLESLGLLAGGMAHDFNNILTTILGFAEVARTALPPDSTALPHLARIQAGAERAADLCGQMLAYSGRGHFVVGPVDLSALATSSMPLLDAMVTKRAVITYNLPPGLPRVVGDAAQLRQVMANLVINASEAMGGSGGTIAVRTGEMDADAAYLEGAQMAVGLPGRYVYLEVADDGEGMTAETLAHVFDPFFSTKFTGRGLGLAVVLGIVRGHAGALRVESEPGHGTRFRVLLPPATDPLVEVPEPVEPGRSTWKGTGVVLVVDDEPDVRMLLRMTLRGLGMTVHEAESGPQAIEAFRRRSDEIDVVLLDLTMPGMGGREVYEELRKVRADLPVILMSGYDEQESLLRFPPASLGGFLRKPFRTSDLVRLLRVALGSDDEDAGPG
jgi:two-component system CheB/CheR fusion protein